MIRKYFNLGKNYLFNLNRSLTGSGTKKTLKILKKEFQNLKIKKIKSGTKVFDWKIPPEWNVLDAYILDKFGQKIIDFKKNNLHLIGYSKSVRTKLKKKELMKKIFFLKDKPQSIPYITSYYKKRWGFCTSYNQYLKINKNYNPNDNFKIIINSSYNYKGNLVYGELKLKGKSKEEILVSTYICHPSMANDNLSGLIVVMSLINYFKKKKLEKTIRFIFIPETIGSIGFLKVELKNLKKNLIGGYNLTCIGDERGHACMFSKYHNSPSDEAVIKAYKKLRITKYKIHSFLDRGSDERQYNSPGVDLGITSIFRSKYGTYPEYHTSDDLFNKVVTLKGLKGGYEVAKNSINILLKSIYPKVKILCEPQMGKRGLYPTLSKIKSSSQMKDYMNFIQYSDGKNSLIKISELIKVDFNKTKNIYLKLKKKNIII